MEAASPLQDEHKSLELSVMELTNDRPFGLFDIYEIARSFPQSSDTLLLDTYLTNEEAASARIFRVYKETPPHYHATCDEYLYVLSGRGTFWMGSPEIRANLRLETCCSSSVEPSTPYPTSSSGPWFFSRSTRRAAIQRTSYS
jgi:Cupin domain